MSITILIILSVLFLSYSNGANDNFKGVATLFGSGTTNYRMAIGWATITTFGGSVYAIFLAGQLVEHFSGKGLVPDQIAGSPEFLLAVAIGAGITVLIATFKGLPISTTHSLTGALAGAGIMAVGLDLNLSKLGNTFFLPLLISPLIALLFSIVSYIGFHSLRLIAGITKEHCICIGPKEIIIPVTQPGGILSMRSVTTPVISVDTEEHCIERYSGKFFGINWQKILDFAHYISAGIVCFARGLNDTPKIVAILITVNALDIQAGLFLIGISIALGGLLNARRVAETMSNKITSMNHGQGFVANLTTGLLVVFASRLGLPVSTTHVSVGSIFGIGLLTGKLDKKVLFEILLSWMLTLPIA
ncbi:MAG: inorganic phosphate transporter, partial [Gammaproteobacteria bacterium]|nr:inorganic phosphate transporter [Gammaproteobacteria bacterium]